ncbi:hypothetical protein Y1Q_0019149 [Alligator mississippiensis]|uniref:Uncharacterized protein n=1 Tax=Alligator mississippiensis TaxID=8496 RepID=A0A151MQJ8_ALLMI|nr:hypothetical protein Y1Q_0019149 [Alligator mississippiensis]
MSLDVVKVGVLHFPRYTPSNLLEAVNENYNFSEQSVLTMQQTQKQIKEDILGRIPYHFIHSNGYTLASQFLTPKKSFEDIKH